MKKMSYKYKVFISFVVIFVVQSIIFWAILFSWTEKTLTEAVLEDFTDKSNTVMTRIDKEFEHLDYFNTSLIQQSIFKKFVSLHYELYYSSIADLKKQITVNMAINPFSSNMFIYFKANDKVLSSFSNFTSSQDFFKDFIELDDINQKEFNSLIKDNEPGNKWVFTNYKTGEKNWSDSILYLNEYAIFSSTETDVSIGHFVDVSQLEAIAKQTLLDDYYSLIILKDDEMIPISLSSKYDSKILADYLKSKKIEKGWHDVEFENEEYIVNVTYDKGLKRKYILYSQKKYFYNEIAQMRWKLILLLTVLVILEIIIVYLIAGRNTKPIDRIRKALLETKNLDDSSNSISWLEENIVDLVHEDNKLKEQIKESTPELRELYLKKLVYRQNEYPNIINKLEDVGVVFSYKYYRMMEVWFYEDVYKMFEVEQIEEVFSKEHAIGVDIYTLKPADSQSMVVIINYDRYNNVESYLELVIGRIESLDISFYLGLGNQIDDMLMLSQSAFQAKESLNYHPINNLERISRYEDINEDKFNNVCHYPIRDENLIIDYLTGGNEEKAFDVIEKLYEENKRNSASFIGMRAFLINAISTAYRALKSSNINIENNHDIQKLFSLNDIKQMKQYVKDVFHDVAEIFEKHQDDPKNILLDEVLHFISIHFKDSSLSLVSIADYVGVHKVYLSTFFNEQMEMSIVDYINKKRIAYSLKLIKEDDKPFSKIFESCGFNSMVTFRRAFKKHVGVLPTEYKATIKS